MRREQGARGKNPVPEQAARGFAPRGDLEVFAVVAALPLQTLGTYGPGR